MDRLIFFDLDGTIINENSGVKLAEILTKRTSRMRWKEFWDSQSIFSYVRYDIALSLLSEVFARCLRDTEIEQMSEAIDELSKFITFKDGFNDFYKKLIEFDYKIFVLTASPYEVFNAVNGYKFNGEFGLILGKTDGKYDGTYLPMNPRQKQEQIDDILNNFEKKHTIGITDSFHDLPAYEKLDIKILLDDNIVTSNYVDLMEIL